ncbi:MAG TPA: GtrA family protein [Alphaproteobacteria bacterium]|nr:GtrA family protein [Alphaproteobacteria bacterium]
MRRRAMIEFSCTKVVSESADVLAPAIHRVMRYGLAGATALTAHLVVLSALVELAGWQETVSSGAGFLCAVPINFWLQRTFVFRSQGACLLQFGRYALVTATTLALNIAAFAALVEWLRLHYVTAQVISTGAALAANFVLNQHVAFATKPIARGAR